MAEVSVGLRAAGLVLGALIGVLSVYLAQTIPPRMDVEPRQRPPAWWAAAVLVGVVYGWLAAGAGGWSHLAALAAFGATTLAVTLIDLDHQLIPNRVLFPGLGVATVLLVIASAIESEMSMLIRGVLAGLVYFAFLLVVALLARGGFGMGDVKLALLLGLFLGYIGWDVLAVGLILAILLGGVASVAVLVFTKKGKDSKFAYGPYLVAGAWVGLFWGDSIANWYLGT